MNYLLTLSDADIFPDVKPCEVDNSWSKRTAVRIIVIDEEGNVAMVGTKHTLLPGGGVEAGEGLEEAVQRECLEEVGCSINVISKVGITQEIEAKKKHNQTTHCFVAKVVGEKGEPQTTQESELGIQVHWHSINKALKLLKKQKEESSLKSYHLQFNVRNQQVFLEKYLKDNA